MKRNHYESMAIINAAIEEDLIESAINRILDLIKVNGGEIVDVDKWGRKRLAYAIEKTKSGYYVVIRFTAPTDLIAKLDRLYQLDEHILRHLTIVLDKFALEYLENNKTQKAQANKEEVKSESSDSNSQGNEEKVENEAKNL